MTVLGSPVAAPIPRPASGTTFEELVNYVVDGIEALIARFGETALVLQFVVVAMLVALVVLVARRLLRKRIQLGLPSCLLIVCAGSLALCLLLFVEQRIGRVQAESARLRAQTTDALFAVLGKLPRSGRAPLCDEDAALRALRARFGEATLRAFACNSAIDVVRVNLKLPLVDALLAVIDLEHKDLVIELDGKFDKKSLTSAFAQATGCAIAINGEAGASPGPNSGLGPWRGHLVQNGSVLLAETADNPLPFLSFDRQNRARFKSSLAKERALPADSYNVIYGRVDSIVAGKAIIENFRHNQPRTVMGIDAAGTRLFLLVVDGRQMHRSWGLTRAEVGDFLRAFGVHDAMLCDEGGSSCMVVDVLGGLATVPASDGGQERPTYSHFGVALRPASSRPTK